MTTATTTATTTAYKTNDIELALSTHVCVCIDNVLCVSVSACKTTNIIFIMFYYSDYSSIEIWPGEEDERTTKTRPEYLRPNEHLQMKRVFGIVWEIVLAVAFLFSIDYDYDYTYCILHTVSQSRKLSVNLLDDKLLYFISQYSFERRS